MNGYTGTISPPGIYVRALYDYDADDQTSLSFRQGDIIQVLTQLESGWWDGGLNGHRGWFPSNYCEFVSTPEAQRLDQDLNRESDEGDIEGSSEDDYEDTSLGNGMSDTASPRSQGPTARRDQEEGAFWIPQATPDGRLFYFNTLTLVSTLELPLESPVATSDRLQRSRANQHAADSSRPPPELMAGGYEREDDTDFEQSASETEESSKTRSSQSEKKRASHLSDGVSPATSLESLNMTSSPKKSIEDGPSDQNGTGFTSAKSSLSQEPDENHQQKVISRKYVDDDRAVPLTWACLIKDMRHSVERYQQVINDRQHAEYVRRAEDISDHLRLLLAAGSGTTDDHSGFPSIISTNKALYPHFRDMMSRFSKLVLSSHIASADFAAPDSCLKCLQEAEGMLKGVYGFVDVARKQRGEEIPRLFPGFVKDSQNGGSWQNNGLLAKDSLTTMSFIDQDDYEPPTEPTLDLSISVMERMNDLKRLIVSQLRRLEERLVIQDRVISQQKHKRLSHEICGLCGKVTEQYRPWMAHMESLDLTTTGLNHQSPPIIDFGLQKQKIYVYIGELVMSCQSVAAPLADEWESNQGDTLEERIDRVRSVSNNLEAATSKVNHSIQRFLDMNAGSKPPQIEQNGHSAHQQTPSSSTSSTAKTKKTNPHTSIATLTETSDAAALFDNAGSTKISKFFGVTPLVRENNSTVSFEDLPWFLGLDYEGEVQYDMKTEPPSIKGGTLIGLVEQLTRHDRYDAPFKTTFLLTYQSFTTAVELFEALIRRWNVQPPPGLTDEDDLELWKQKKQHPIRMRIVNVMKSWIDTYWMELNDAKSLDLITRVYNFAKDTVASSGIPGWRPLLNVIEQRMRGEDTSAKRLVPNPNFQAPLPILPKNMKKLKFHEIDPTEFARQLTIIESRLYGKIKPHECLNKIWQNKGSSNDQDSGANVKALILHSNRLTNWVAEMILTQPEVKKRVNVIKHFVLVADVSRKFGEGINRTAMIYAYITQKCQNLNNYSTLTSIISAFGTAPIHRLSRTWSQVNRATATILERMRRLMGSTKNFQQYREALHAANPPCIPFFGVYLTDLTFIEDGIPSIIKKTDLINFAKRAKTAEVIREIQTYQNVSYPFKAVPELQDYILSMMQSAGDVHEMYEKSLQVEPREREDEKIARLLSESGFL